MKHFYLTFIAALTSATAISAQSADMHFLREATADNDVPVASYTYDAAGHLLTALNLNNNDLTACTRMEIFYDEDGREIAEDHFQNLKASDNPEDYVKVSRFEYFYNAEGKLTERKVYNVYDSSSTDPASRWTFSYNDAGNVAEILIFMDAAGTDPMQQIKHYYNTKKLLVKKETYSNFMGASGLSTVTDYEYDSSNRPVRQREYSYISSENRLSATMSIDYVYNVDGSLQQIDEYNSDRTMLVQQKIYTATGEFALDEAALPISLDETLTSIQLPAFSLGTMPLTGYEARAFNEFSGLTEPYEHVSFAYKNVGEGEENNDNDSIDPIAVAAGFSARVSGNMLQLSGVDAGAMVSITDLEGRTIITAAYAGDISIDSLGAGVYVVSIASGASAKFVKF